MTRTLIIGGSAAGAAVAARLRRLDEHQDNVLMNIRILLFMKRAVRFPMPAADCLII